MVHQYSVQNNNYQFTGIIFKFTKKPILLWILCDGLGWDGDGIGLPIENLIIFFEIITYRRLRNLKIMKNLQFNVS